MSKLITRRKLITGGLTLSAAAASAVLGNRFGLVPPDYDGIFGVGETVTFAVHRLLLSGQPLAREFRRDQISTHFPAINTTLPEDPFYREQMAAGFREWTLPIDGLVTRPGEFTLAQLKSFPSRTQITQHICEQGWSAIAEWTGVPLSTVLQSAGIRSEARYVVFFTTDDWWDSLDMADALHPQTLLTYGMNGRDLPVPHGAPVRLRVERQLGYKNLKYLSQITVTDSVKDISKGKGAIGAEFGYAWYAGI
jgi:DMSO/TMAO reductase YedYZ molybdopterin-dependent catalytic subunit